MEQRKPTCRVRSGTRLLPALLLGVLLAGCAAQGARSDNDPLEPLNRKIFWFNLKAQKYVLDPVARVWHAAMPDPAERALARFFDNLDFPIDLVNNLLQGKAKGAGVESLRFLVNSTVGIGGLFDPAASWGFEAHPEDFGQTLGVWGFHPGPYLMLPLWGPSNVRESFGLVGDYYGSLRPFVLNSLVWNSAFGTEVVNREGLDLEAAKKRKAAALDYYVFVRDAYFQRRQAQVKDTYQVGEKRAEDLYDYDVDQDEQPKP